MSYKEFIQCLILTAILLASFASTGNVQASSSCGSTYVVQPGDWLSKIARPVWRHAVSIVRSQPGGRILYLSRPGAGYPGRL